MSPGAYLLASRLDEAGTQALEFPLAHQERDHAAATGTTILLGARHGTYPIGGACSQGR